MNNTIYDQAIRQQALNPAESFIVQAPAGSGKTELLIQRFLRLLTIAESPEEIISITFTRKAAGEMRERILHALHLARNPQPTEAHKLATWQLAQAVIARSNQKKWHLEQNPNRLRIMTIDALSALLNGQIPLLSGFGASIDIEKNAVQLYKTAVERLFAHLKYEGTVSEALQFLLLQLENNAEQLSALLIELLSKREQWLPHIISHRQDTQTLRKLLESSLQHINEELCVTAQTLLTQNELAIITKLIQFKYKTDFNTENINHWRYVAETFLTKDFKIRKSLNKTNGFPTEEPSMKALAMSLLNEWQDQAKIVELFENILFCPSNNYSNSQWQLIEALLEVLPLLTAELTILFQEHGVIDFTEQTLGALRALGSDEHSTELALYLDYQIKHLLIDEFQDTAVVQFHLIEKLVREWQPNDGRSIFIVGDPMQSIYRFRQAEVGLFLRLQQEPLQQIKLTPLVLRCNFRAQAELVEWTNQTFDTLFPTDTDITLGAVPFSEAIATKPALQNQVHYTLHSAESEYSEAEQLLQTIQHLQSTQPQSSVAILVRSRTQLPNIIRIFQQNKLAYQAVELEPLARLPEIQDLLSLTRALHHLDDRIAWLAILRAPWCGILLDDLHIISNLAPDMPLWWSLRQPINGLSADGTQRLNHFRVVINEAFNQQSQLHLAQWIENTWFALGAPYLMRNNKNIGAIQTFFDLLTEQQHQFDLDVFCAEINAKFKTDTSVVSTIQIMTIHKAKGLEFDHVFLPGLQKANPSESAKLLQWLERISLHETQDLVLAPIKTNALKEDQIYEYLRRIEKTKLEFESARLLYVATTRAKQALYLSATIDTTQTEIKPTKNSFLNLLWNKHQHNFLANLITNTQIEISTNTQTGLHRIADITALQQKNTLTSDERLESPETIQLVTPEQLLHQITGTLIHKLVEQQNFAQLDKELWLYRARQMGASNSQLEYIYQQLKLTAENCLADTTAQWIFQSHIDAKNEVAINQFEKGELRTFIIDRTFIDAEGRRWIIDYKSSQPGNQTLAEFLQAEKKQYLTQLTNYAKLYANMDARPIHLGLYFPLCKGWVSWRFNSDKVTT